MTIEDLNEMEATLFQPLSQRSQNKVWIQAFKEYNSEITHHPLSINCGPCYAKVFVHHKQKQNGNRQN